MTARERGFLLLTSTLGDPNRKPLTIAQFRTLAARVAQMDQPTEDRELCSDDLIKLGYDLQMAQRIADLLDGKRALQKYVSRGNRCGCVPLSRPQEAYPPAVRQRLGLDAPGCIWAKGDPSLLNAKTVALVGSRELNQPNRIFAETVGREVARQGYILVSGNARGADQVAQNACLKAGGKVISVVADSLENHKLRENVLYLSEDVFDGVFSAQRALSRNRVIHSLGYITFVAQCDLGTGGTWNGSVQNLQKIWSPVFCFDDGSDACLALQQLGATLIKIEQLSDIAGLQQDVQMLI